MYVQIIKAITLLCTTSQLHHKSQIRPRRLLGDLPRLHGPCTCTVPLATCHVRTLPLARGPQAWGPDTSQSGSGTQLGRLDTDYLGSVYTLDWTTGLDYWTGLLDSPKMV